MMSMLADASRHLIVTLQTSLVADRGLCQLIVGVGIVFQTVIVMSVLEPSRWTS